MRVLLVQPLGVQRGFTRRGTLLPPLGLLCVAGGIREVAEIRLVDADVGEMDDAAVVRAVGDWQPDVVGMTLSALTSECVRRFADVAKREWSPVVIVGGPLPSAAPEAVLGYEDIDLVNVGDGEDSMRELCVVLTSGAAVSSVAGIIERGGNAGNVGTTVARRADLGRVGQSSRRSADVGTPVNFVVCRRLADGSAERVRSTALRKSLSIWWRGGASANCHSWTLTSWPTSLTHGVCVTACEGLVGEQRGSAMCEPIRSTSSLPRRCGNPGATSRTWELSLGMTRRCEGCERESSSSKCGGE